MILPAPRHGAMPRARPWTASRLRFARCCDGRVVNPLDRDRPAGMDDPESGVARQPRVDRLPASGEGIVIVEQKNAPRTHAIGDSFDAELHRIVPVAIDVGEGNRAIEPQCVLERTLEEEYVGLIDVDSR